MWRWIVVVVPFPAGITGLVLNQGKVSLEGIDIIPHPHQEHDYDRTFGCAKLFSGMADLRIYFFPHVNSGSKHPVASHLIADNRPPMINTYFK